ncbi:MAG: glycoside hydrolase family 3 C-terminal domain-containing protein, partial [Oscillibacter sp.]|nr:glycoside hydrolase family 3 C-terminal domain-containing protein [Oscillibacter sp.]
FAKNPRYQGAGSSVVNCTKLDNAMDLIGNTGLDVIGYAQGYPRTGPGDRAMLEEAVELAKKADVVLLYIGLDEISEAEGLDRPNMKLSRSQTDLINAVANVNENIVAVMAAGSSVEMSWLARCKALIHGCLHGQAGAGAVLRAVMGEVNPSGKLSETYALKYHDVPSSPYFPARERTVEYREGLYVGYRYFETVKKPVQFPFGFGLSYTTFEYSNLSVTDAGATFTLTNTGDRDGAEVAQLYVSAKSPSVYRPAKELKGFQKVFLKAGESKSVTIPFDDKAFRYFNVKTNQFEIDGGEYGILIGASVADIRLKGEITVEGTKAPAPYERSQIPSYFSGEIEDVSDKEFETLLGRPIPDGHWSGTIGMNDAICQLYYARSLKARIAYKILTGLLNRSMKQGKPDLNIIFIYNMPFRGIGKMTGGMVSQEMCEGILTIVNGHAIALFQGLGKIISGYFKQRKAFKKAQSME